MPSDSNAEFILEFVAESREHLDTGESCLLRLVRDHADSDAVQACFRALHTIKGGAGFMGLERIQSLAHVAEQLLDAVRDNRLKAAQPICDVLLAAVSRLREMIDAAEQGGEASGDDHPLIERLRALLPHSESEDYRPSVETPASKRRQAIASVTSLPPATAIPLDELAADLVVLDPGDAAALQTCLGHYAEAAQVGAWSPAALTILDQMRGLSGRLADPASRGRAHTELLELAEQLGRTVASTRLSIAPVPSSQAPGQASVPISQPPPDLPSVADFLAETGELLSQAEAVLLAAAQPDAAQVGDLFRSFHTVKGMASYLGHPRIEQLAHVIESRFTAVRDGQEAFTAEHHHLALTGIDALRQLGSELRRKGQDIGIWPASAAGVAKRLGLQVDGAQGYDSAELALPPEVPRLGDLLVQTGAISRSDIEAVAAVLKPGERIGEKLIESGKVTREVVEQAVSKQADLMSKAQGEGFARVSIARLEELVNLVGELLIAQAMVAQEPDVMRSPRLGVVVGRQARVVRDLQGLALGLRLVPLRATFQKMARAIHDTARKLEKQVDFQLVGEDVEVDRTLVEAIADPLLHMVRNAVDHGIEGKAARLAAGKPATGTVRLSAAHSGDHVTVQLSDDGKGLDPAKLIAKAKEKGLLPHDAKLSDAEAFNLIFLPGFSTAEQVTAVSGRGVGMDVVKRNLERVKGKAEIASVLGQGSTFTITLPLTTAILDAMVLRVGEDRYLVPVTSIVEALRPVSGQVSEILGRGRVIEARGQLVPVVMLGDMFSIAAAELDPTQCVLLVLEREGGTIALQVDEILGMQQVVIKPLDGGNQRHPGIAGSAIMGDGRVGLILDPVHLLDA